MPTVGLHGVSLGVQSSLHAIDTGSREYAVSSYDSASQAIFAAFTTPPDATRKGQIDAVVVALKAGGIWTKLDALYVFAAADSQAAKINWKAPGTYNCTEVNAPTFTTDRGFTAASTKYLDTAFNPATATTPNFVQNSAVLFAWSRTDTEVNSGIVGMATSGTGESLIFPRVSPGNLTIYINQSSASNFANANGSGLFVITRRASTAIEGYRNTTSLGTGTLASAGVRSANFNFLRRATTYWTGESAGGGFGSQLSAGEVTSLYNALNTYLVAVGAA